MLRFNSTTGIWRFSFKTLSRWRILSLERKQCTVEWGKLAQDNLSIDFYIKKCQSLMDKSTSGFGTSGQLFSGGQLPRKTAILSGLDNGHGIRQRQTWPSRDCGIREQSSKINFHIFRLNNCKGRKLVWKRYEY